MAANNQTRFGGPASFGGQSSFNAPQAIPTTGGTVQSGARAPKTVFQPASSFTAAAAPGNRASAANSTLGPASNGAIDSRDAYKPFIPPTGTGGQVPWTVGNAGGVPTQQFGNPGLGIATHWGTAKGMAEGGPVDDEQDNQTSTLPKKQVAPAIPDNDAGTDINSALDTVDQVLQFGRQQYGLIPGSNRPAGAVPDQQNTAQGFEDGGEVQEEVDNPDDIQEPDAAPPGNQEEAIPTFGQSNSAPTQSQDPKRIVAYLQGEGAAPAQAAAGLEKDTGEAQPAMAKLAAINKAAQEGGPMQGFRLMQSYRQQHDLQITNAKVKLNQGQLALAAQAATEADANVLDGTQTHFAPNVGGNGVTATVTKLGEDTPFHRVQMGLKEFWNFLNTNYDAKMDTGTAAALVQANPGAKDAALMPVRAAGRALGIGSGGGTSEPSDADETGALRSGAQGGDQPTAAPQAAPNTEATPPQGVGSKPGQSMLNPPNLDGGQATFSPRMAQDQLAAMSQKTGAAQPKPAQQPGFTPGPQMGKYAQMQKAREEALYGKDPVEAAYLQFPGVNQGPQRAQFMNAERQRGSEQASTERASGAKLQSARDIAQIRAETGRANNQDTNDARRYGADQRHDAAIAAVQQRVQQSGQQVDNQKMMNLRTAMTNNPALAKDPKAAIDYYNSLTAGLPQRPAAQAAPQGGGQQAPQRKQFNGQWYVRGPDGKPVLDSNQNAQ